MKSHNNCTPIVSYKLEASFGSLTGLCQITWFRLMAILPARSISMRNQEGKGRVWSKQMFCVWISFNIFNNQQPSKCFYAECHFANLLRLGRCGGVFDESLLHYSMCRRPTT